MLRYVIGPQLWYRRLRWSHCASATPSFSTIWVHRSIRRKIVPSQTCLVSQGLFAIAACCEFYSASVFVRHLDPSLTICGIFNIVLGSSCQPHATYDLYAVQPCACGDTTHLLSSLNETGVPEPIVGAILNLDVPSQLEPALVRLPISRSHTPSHHDRLAFCPVKLRLRNVNVLLCAHMPWTMQSRFTALRVFKVAYTLDTRAIRLVDSIRVNSFCA